MSYKYFLPIGFFIFSFAVLLAIKDSTRSETLSCPDFNQATLTINQHSVNIALAITPTQQTKGLSGCENIPKNSGMFFPFSEKKIASFWMKEMFVPIDILWISDGRVIGIEHDVKAPNNLKDTNLPIYSPIQPINSVLEMPAGASHKLNINIGDSITIN